jgi:hypothetical protein
MREDSLWMVMGKGNGPSRWMQSYPDGAAPTRIGLPGKH